MLHFECDYLEGAHPAILEKLLATNLEQTVGYGEDSYSASAREKIRTACGVPQAQVQFVSGGTQANMIVIRSLLRPHQGVLAADTGHINVHETGAIEAYGHKVLALPHALGKIDAAQVEAAYQAHWQDGAHEHTVQPGMVYISQSTEYGTLYSLAELEALSAVCRRHHLHFFVDGARLGYALAADGNDVTLTDLARLCDVFYIGGTKVGALFGEAIVIPDPTLLPDVRYLIKQSGGMLAKGRMLGLQFDVLFTDALYHNISAHAICLAHQLRDGLAAKGYRFLMDSPTNQQFVIVEDAHLTGLQQQLGYSYWERYDDRHSVIRLVTSWATREEDINALLALF